MGPQIVMQVVEERAPNGFTKLEHVITREELESIARAYRRTAGFDRDARDALAHELPMSAFAARCRSSGAAG